MRYREECLGSVKWYNVEKGFGFVAQDRGGKDVFVHATTRGRGGLNELAEGQRVRMQISQGLRLDRSSSWTDAPFAAQGCDWLALVRFGREQRRVGLSLGSG